MPSLVVAALPAALLVLLRDRLLTESRHRSQATVPHTAFGTPPLTTAGFQGWFSIDGATEKSDGAATTRSGLKRLEDGLSHGHASLMDTRLAMYVILLWKCQLDDSTLEIAGGCGSMKVVCDVASLLALDTPGDTVCSCFDLL
jgi:hypothetical protein